MPRGDRRDHLFGGQPGAAQRALASMKRRYGPEQGQLVFDATVIKRERGAGKRQKKPPPFTRGAAKKTLAQRFLGG